VRKDAALSFEMAGAGWGSNREMVAWG